MRAAAPAASDPASGLLARWGRFAVRRRGTVLLGWLAAFVLLVVLGATFRGTFDSSFSIPGTETQTAFDLLKERFPQRAGDTATLVFKAESGVAEPASPARIEAALQESATLPGVVGVQSPFAAGGERQVSPDGRIAYATLQYGGQANAVPKRDVEKLFDLTEDAHGDGLTVEAGGQIAQFNE